MTFKPEEEILKKGIEDVFGKTAILLNDLAAELVEVEAKYPKSRIYEKKLSQINQLRTFYDKTLAYIDHLIEQNYSMGQAFFAEELIRTQAESGLSFQKIAELLGDPDPGQWAAVDDWEQRLERIKQKLKIAPSVPLIEFLTKHRVTNE